MLLPPRMAMQLEVSVDGSSEETLKAGAAKVSRVEVEIGKTPAVTKRLKEEEPALTIC